jgi:elongation factor P--beta-lysine ligase
MKLLNIHKRVKSLLSTFTTPEKAGEHRDARKAWLLELKMYEWYRHIVDYRESEAEAAMQALSDTNTPKELISYHQARHNAAISFLDWLNNSTAD